MNEPKSKEMTTSYLAPSPQSHGHLYVGSPGWGWEVSFTGPPHTSLREPQLCIMEMSLGVLGWFAMLCIVELHCLQVSL
jgi:hypothetical protein